MYTDKIPVIRKMLPEDSGFLCEVAGWMYSWWGEKEGYCKGAIMEYLSNSLRETGFPQSYGMFLDDKIIGFFQLTMSDLFVRPDLYPWLANVYVHEDYRGYGYGKLLLNSISSIINTEQDVREIYLYTTHEGLYERFGWEFVEKTDTFLENRIQNIYKLTTK